MTDNSNDELARATALCHILAEAFGDANEQEIDRALGDVGLQPDAFSDHVASTIEHALNAALKKKLVAAGHAARAQLAEVRPDLSSLSREQLIEKLKIITANEDNAGETLTMAARGGRDSMSVDELRSLIEDFYSIHPAPEDD